MTLSGFFCLLKRQASLLQFLEAHVGLMGLQQMSDHVFSTLVLFLAILGRGGQEAKPSQAGIGYVLLIFRLLRHARMYLGLSR